VSSLAGIVEQFSVAFASIWHGSISTSIEMAQNLASGRAESYITDRVGHVFCICEENIRTEASCDI
jgi:hypothetical protein